MAIVLSNACSIRDARLEGTIIEVIREWATKHPDQLVNLDKHVHALRDCGAGKELTDAGTMLHKAEIPATLYWMLDNKVRRGWAKDSRVRKLVFRNFTVGMVNRKAEMRD